MTCYYYRVTNYSSVADGYYRWTGCTGVVSVSSISPLNSEYVCAQDLVKEGYSGPLSIVNTGLCPSPTPTPTPIDCSIFNFDAELNCNFTPPQSPTPTTTPTPSATPVLIYERNLRGGGWYQDVCQSHNMFANPANAKIFTTKPFNTLQVGDHAYGDRELTIPPIGGYFTISDGATFIQLSGTMIINVGVC
jgi:hypothetical protein